MKRDNECDCECHLDGYHYCHDCVDSHSNDLTEGDFYVEVYNPLKQREDVHSKEITEKGEKYFNILKDLEKINQNKIRSNQLDLRFLEVNGFIVKAKSGWKISVKGGKVFEALKTFHVSPMNKVFGTMQKVAYGINQFSDQMDKFGKSMEKMGGGTHYTNKKHFKRRRWKRHE